MVTINIKRRIVSIKENIEEFLKNRHQFSCYQSIIYTITDRSTGVKKTIKIRSYVPKNFEFVWKQKFFQDSRRIVEGALAEAMIPYVKDIPEENFDIKVFFILNPISIVMRGSSIQIDINIGSIKISEIQRDYLIMYINFPLFQLFKSFRGEVIHHELAHFFDQKQLKKSYSLLEKIDSQYERLRNVIGNLHALLILFLSLRSEGIAKFYGEFKARKKVVINPKYFSQFMKIINKVAYSRSEISNLASLYNAHGYAIQEFGKGIVSLIILYKLSINNLSFSAWIRKRNMLGIGKDHNMNQIGYFFEQGKFSIIFTDPNLYNLIESEVLKLCNLGTNDFIKEYVKAYLHFKFCPEHFNAQNYHYYIKMAQANAFEIFEKSKRQKTA